jgi:hypothetical protein
MALDVYYEYTIYYILYTMSPLMTSHHAVDGLSSAVLSVLPAS